MIFPIHEGIPQWPHPPVLGTLEWWWTTDCRSPRTLRQWCGHAGSSCTTSGESIHSLLPTQLSICNGPERNSPSPDGIGGQTLKNCGEQLADIFCFIFMLSLQLHKAPCLSKDCILVPVPKNKAPKSLNDYRPVVRICGIRAMCHGWACLFCLLCFWFCLCSGGSLLFSCIGVPCGCSYVMHIPNAMSSLFGSFLD